MKTNIKKVEMKRNEWSEQNRKFWGNQKQSLIAVSKDGFNIVTVQWNYTKSGICKAIVSVNACDYGRGFANGFGNAGGYGYCKSSAAVEQAFRNAGIEIENLSGTGLIREAVETLAYSIAGDNFLTVVSI